MILNYPSIKTGNSSVFVLSVFQVLAFNRTVKAQPLDDNSGMQWTNTSSKPEFLVGEEVGRCYVVKVHKRRQHYLANKYG